MKWKSTAGTLRIDGTSERVAGQRKEEDGMLNAGSGQRNRYLTLQRQQNESQSIQPNPTQPNPCARGRRSSPSAVFAKRADCPPACAARDRPARKVEATLANFFAGVGRWLRHRARPCAIERLWSRSRFFQQRRDEVVCLAVAPIASWISTASCC